MVPAVPGLAGARIASVGRERFAVAAEGGELAGLVDAGSGRPTLLLHGGPGLSFEYLEPLADELGEGFRVAAFQQRGLEPSTLAGPHTVAQAIVDVIAVLDGLGWERAALVGHSWGAHLALRVAAAHPERVDVALAIDPLGLVEDGGRAAFAAELTARVPTEGRERLDVLDADGEGESEAGALESLAIFWPGYFADPSSAPPMPPMRMSVDAHVGIMADVAAGAEAACAELARGRARYGVLCGAASPIPWGQAGFATAELSPAGTFVLVPNAGHFPWLEVPGSVRDALLTLTA
jgi:pimeloyl-ACP methyl ester carboxylesterase